MAKEKMIRYRAAWYEDPEIVHCAIEKETKLHIYRKVKGRLERFCKNDHFVSYFDTLKEARGFLTRKMDAEISVQREILNQLEIKKLKAINAKLKKLEYQPPEASTWA